MTIIMVPQALAASANEARPGPVWNPVFGGDSGGPSSAAGPEKRLPSRVGSSAGSPRDHGEGQAKAPLRRRCLGSLACRITLTVVAASLLAAALAAGLLLEEQRRRDLTDLRVEAQGIMVQLQSLLADPLWRPAKPATEEILRQQLRWPEVRAILVLDERGGLLAGLAKDPGGVVGPYRPEREATLLADTYRVEGSVVRNSATVGTIRLFLRGGPSRRSWRRRAARDLLAVAGMAATLALALGLALRRMVVRPLQGLRQWADQAFHGRDTAPPPLGGADEMDSLARAFGTLAAARAGMQDALRRAHRMESVGRQAGALAHDLCNLLTVMRTNVSLTLGHLAAGDPSREMLEEADAAAESAGKLTRRILALGREQAPSPRVLDVNEAVLGTERIMRRLLGPEVTLRIRPDPALWPVLADPAQVEQVLLNLAVNARDAMPDGGELRIETGNAILPAIGGAMPSDLAAGDYVVLSVADTGTGMGPSVLPHIFEPFFTTKVPGAGTGLGLATVLGIVREHGGALQVDSEVGRGTTFRIYLPRTSRRGSDDPP